MTNDQHIPAAQYLRMSTEHQRYSLDNQFEGIQRYAESHGFEVVHTYSDGAKSGVALKRRTGLRQLLQDVICGSPSYRAILVYDVSRWGRFQDTDESAHYEFVCKSAGVPVHYCAESFANDGSLSSLIMKALKRTMAGEYSRELGTKVLAGQQRLAALGFKQGGTPGYALGRMLISADGQANKYYWLESVKASRPIELSSFRVQPKKYRSFGIFTRCCCLKICRSTLSPRSSTEEVLAIIDSHDGLTTQSLRFYRTRSTPDFMSTAAPPVGFTQLRSDAQDQNGFSPQRHSSLS